MSRGERLICWILVSMVWSSQKGSKIDCSTPAMLRMTRGKGGRDLSSKKNRGMAKCHESPECKVRRRAE